MAVDPKYFDWGGAFLGGLQQAHEGQRRNALLDLENRQYGLQERRLNMADQARADELKKAEVDSLKRATYGRYLSGDKSAFAKIAELEGLGPEDFGQFTPEQQDNFVQAMVRFNYPDVLGKNQNQDYTLPPGAARFDASNRLVAERPFAPANMSVIQLPGGQGAFNPRDASVIPLSDRADQRAAEAQDVAAKAGSEAETKRLSGFVDDGVRAADGTATIRRSLELLNEVKTGGIDVVKLKVANLFGVTGADEGELSANLGKAVLSQLRSTFGAQFTEQEGKRLEGIEAGFGKSTEANKRLLDQALKLMERAARRGLDAAERLNDTFSANEIRNALGTNLTPGAKPKPQTKDGWSIEPVE